MLPEDYQYHQERAGQNLLTRKPGRMWARASLICAVWSLFIAPAVVGPLGVAAGMVAIARGSAVAALVGYWWAVVWVGRLKAAGQTVRPASSGLMGAGQFE